MLTWAGIGLGAQSALAQAGTSVDTPGIGQYQGWYEVLPDQTTLNLLPLSGAGGWRFEADITRYSGYYHFYVYDSFSGNWLGFNVPTSSYDGSHADFIVERPLTNGSLLNLTNFNTEQFNDAWVNGSNPIGNYPNAPISMYNGANLLASATSLSNKVSFTDVWWACQ
jgi:hypothetical protein